MGTTTKTRSKCNGPLPDHWGEGFLCVPPTFDSLEVEVFFTTGREVMASTKIMMR